MTTPRIIILTVISIIAFAGNSLLGRIAFTQTQIDATSFTSIRLISGALMLSLMARLLSKNKSGKGDWGSSVALFVYAISFSFAYTGISTATGALLLFGAVQITMIGHGFLTGERLHGKQLIGLALAIGGLFVLLLPGLSSPPLWEASLMFVSGAAWGVYSIRGKGAGDPTRITAGNFLLASIFTIAASFLTREHAQIDQAGVGYAIASGALASGLGYALWYSVLPSLKSTSASTIQLSVPPLAALAGILFLGEQVSPRFILASVATLTGITLVMLQKKT